jgi:transposase-like protein
MKKGIRVEAEAGAGYGGDTLEKRARVWIRGFIEGLLEEELTAALGVERSGRVGPARRGYRHGVRQRTLTTSMGPTSFSMPRARVFAGEAGGEWSSQVLPRYQRRTARVDEAILGLYLSGANTRRIKGALSPLLKGAPLSKDAVSRLLGRLSEDFEAWRHRELSGEKVVYLFLDGWYPRVRLGKRRVKVPVLVTMGVGEDGSRVVLDFRLAGSESAGGWREAIVSLSERGIGVPRLAVIDGGAGLEKALREVWPRIAIQRCTAHKLRNLEGKAPVRMREELKEDYRRMVYAETAAAVEQARSRFLKKWRLACPPVAASLEEAGDELFTFLKFPRSQWKALRTTNALERINEEFRRRTKTQASLPGESAVLLLLFGLLRSGQIRLRAIDGCHEMKAAA